MKKTLELSFLPEQAFDDEIIKSELINGNKQSLINVNKILDSITINEILSSPVLKLELCQHIGASNWRRWKVI